jgi:hypothetical protein
MVACPLLPWTISSAAAVDSCHVHSSSPLATSDHVQGAGYSEFEVETDVAALKLETDAAALELETEVGALKFEMETDVSQLISKQERYSAD